MPDTPDIQLALLDTHADNKGILGSSPLRPDCAMYLKGRFAVPLTTLGFVELERTSDVDDLESIGQAVSYGETLLQQLAPGLRRQALVGVTDLKTIQWVLVSMENGKFVYQVAEKQDDARASLFAVLRQDWSTSAGLQLPVFRPPMELQDFLGSGSSGVVYKCNYNGEVRALLVWIVASVAALADISTVPTSSRHATSPASSST